MLWRKRVSNVGVLIGGPTLNHRTIPLESQKVPVAHAYYDVGDFVYCWVLGEFGHVSKRLEDHYAIKLINGDIIPNIFVNNLWEGGQG